MAAAWANRSGVGERCCWEKLFAGVAGELLLLEPRFVAAGSKLATGGTGHTLDFVPLGRTFGSQQRYAGTARGRDG